MPDGYTLYRLEGGAKPKQIHIHGTHKPPSLFVNGKRYSLVEVPGHPENFRDKGVYLDKASLFTSGKKGSFKKDIAFGTSGESLNIYFIGKRILKAEIDRTLFFFEVPFKKEKLIPSSHQPASHWVLRGPIPQGAQVWLNGKPLQASKGFLELPIPLKVGKGLLSLSIKLGRKMKKRSIPYSITKK